LKKRKKKVVIKEKMKKKGKGEAGSPFATDHSFPTKLSTASFPHSNI
jgi:hypothetical protein